MILGFPGVGKSTSAKAIAASYQLGGNPSLYLTFDRASSEVTIRFEIVILGTRSIPIPVVTVPSHLLETEEVQKSIIKAKDKISKLTDQIGSLKSIVDAANDDRDTMSKVQELLKDFFSELPKEYATALEYTKLISDALPYVGSILKIFIMIGQIKRQVDLKDLEKANLLIVLDDLEDLRPNWIVLNKLMNRKFRFLFIKRVENPEDYLALPNNRTFANDFLKSMGIPRMVNRRIILPLPTLQVFEQMMANNKIPTAFVEDLWQHSGGIPAIALMMWVSKGADGLDSVIHRIDTSLHDKSVEPVWGTDDVRRRIDFALNAATAIYKTLRDQNYAYVALVIQPFGVSINELALFCGYMFGEICRCADSNVQKIVDLVGITHGPDKKPIILTDVPCSSCPCGFEVDRNLVQTGVDDWYAPKIEGNKIIRTTLPSVRQENKGVIYAFDSLFQHIPLLLSESNRIDDDIRIELEQARKALLSITAAELRVTGVSSFRLSWAAIDHLDKISNFQGIEDSAVMLLKMILWNSPGLLLARAQCDHVLDKVYQCSKLASARNRATLLTAVCNLYSLKRASPTTTSTIEKILLHLFDELFSSTDRLVSRRDKKSRFSHEI
jgi:hypothetical protein